MAKLRRPGQYAVNAYGRLRGLEERIIEVVRVEGPVHRDVVLNRLRECYYPHRFTGRVRHGITVLIDEEVRRRDDSRIRRLPMDGSRATRSGTPHPG